MDYQCQGFDTIIYVFFTNQINHTLQSYPDQVLLKEKNSFLAIKESTIGR